MTSFNESDVEAAALAWLEGLGWEIRYGPAIAVGEPGAERSDPSSRDVILEGRLRQALARLNPELPAEAQEDALRKLTRLDAPSLLERNRAAHRMLVNGVTVEYRRSDGSIAGEPARVIDYDDPSNNDWVAVHQLTVREGQHTRRPDVVLFVNGLPLAVIELKNPAGETSTVWAAWRQLQTYQAQIPSLFATNAALIASDGVEARIGALGAGKEWFKPWRTSSGREAAPASLPQLQVLLEGVFEQRRFLDLLRHFIVFEDSSGTGEGGTLSKKLAGYHQFHAVQVAVSETLRAAQRRASRPWADRPGPTVARPSSQDRYSTCVPLVPLQAAAGAFGAPRQPGDAEPEVDFEWVAVPSRRRLRPGMFVTRVEGRSMEPEIPDGSWCLFSAPVTGTRQGKTVLVELQDAVDPETGERYTVKRYDSEKAAAGDSWQHARIRLMPLNPAFQPIELSPDNAERLQVVAELVEVLGDNDPRGQEPGDRRIGVVWHTQGSGKSLTMAFYAGRVILHPAMENPTIVVITDRNDLDDQLFGTFARCRDLLRQPPVQAADRADLREKLKVASGGVVFTTIQKFFPEERGDRHPRLSERRNIVVIADEAHRSQYDFIDGFARHMRDALPHASFVGFTGTPIEKTDANTRAVFGDYISIYDIERAVADGATVPIYYESRLAKLQLSEAEKPHIDPDFEEATEGEEIERKEKLKSKWAQLEAVVGTGKRLQQIARDLVEHYEKRCEVIAGKAMVVVMSRRIAVELYRELVALRPPWHGDDDTSGALKVVMTGSASDPLEWQPHIRNKSRREALAQRFRDANDPFRIVIVRDMWLTGFDAPSLSTMYVDKPMRAHGLMQAIARVNRVFRDKPGGLVVDYLGLAEELKQALASYTEAGGTGKAAHDQAEAVAVMLEKVEICRGLFGPYRTPAGAMGGFDWSRWRTGTSGDRLALLPAAQEHILAQEDGKARLLGAVTQLSQAFALAATHPEAERIRDEVAFYQAVRAVLASRVPGERKTDEELEHAIRQIVSRALVSGEVVDIFAAAGLRKPDLSILSDEFLAEVRGMPQRNLAVELLQKLLQGEIKQRRGRNVVQARSFAEMLEQAIRRYQNRAIETAQVIEELIQLAREMRAEGARGEELGLTEAEVAFYDALEANDSAVKVLGDETLKTIARELVATVRRNVTLDWTLRENVKAQLRVYVKRILRKHGYPPDKEEKATQTVLEQAEVLSEAWAVD